MRTPGTTLWKLALLASLGALAVGTACSGPADDGAEAVSALATTLPSPWQEADIGAVGLTGSASFDGTTYTVKGAGTDLWGSSDSFHFAYQPFSGDGTVVAKVTSQQNTASWAKAGVMIRETLDPASRYVMMSLTPTSGAAFQRRSSTGGSTAQSVKTGIKAPYWVRVVRAGSKFTASISPDGATWTQVSSASIGLPSTVLAGLAVTSHNTGVLGTVTFANFSPGAQAGTPPANQPPMVSLSSPAAAASFTAPASVALAATASDADGSIAKVEFFAGSTLVATATAAPFAATWSNVAAGTYSLTARATDNAGAQATSAAVSISVAAPANQAPTVSLTAPAAGATFTAPASVALAASASDADGSVARVEFFAGSTLVATATAAPFTATWSNVAAGTYSLTARATDNAGAQATSAAVSISVAAPAASLPSPWAGADVGNVVLAGKASASGGTFTVDGAGADIWGTADAFQFAEQGLAGDGSVVARVATQQNTNAWAKAGVMVRESNAAGAPFAMMVVTPSNGAAFQARATAGANATSKALAGLVAPYWVKVTRSGSTFTGAVSPDGATWTTVGTATVTMSASALAGLAVTSHTTSALSRCTFDNVGLGAVQPPPANLAPQVSLTSPAASASFTAPATVMLAASASDADGSIARVDFLSGATVLASATAAPFEASWGNVPAGTYTLAARATDNQGATTTSPAVTVTVAAAPGGGSGGGTPGNGALGLSVFNPTSSTLRLSWNAVSGATAIRVFVAPEPSATADAPLPAQAQAAALAGSATTYQVTGLAPAVDVFVRVEADTPAGLVAENGYGRTVGGPRAPLDNAVREVHAMSPRVLQVVLANGSGATWQAGPWTVKRGNGTVLNVTRVSRHSIAVGAPQYTIGFGQAYSDDVIDADHRIYLALDQSLPSPDLLEVTGPSGVRFTLPFSDRYTETPAIQLNQVGFNPRATKRWAYVSGWLGDGGALDLSGYPATADVLSEPADPRAPRPVAVGGIAINLRSSSDPDVTGAVKDINLASVPAAEGVRYRVRIPGVGVSWPTQVSERAALKAYYTIGRGLFFNRWGRDTQSVCPELGRPADHKTVYTAEGGLDNFDYKFPSSQPKTGARTLQGGYHDAGDFDQRPMHTAVAQTLMRAYEIDPSRHADGQLTLPESGNGIPDLLDQALWGIQAWEQLQEPDGGVRMGVESTQHPNGFYFADTDPLAYYTYSRDARTTARVAGLFAQAARLVAPFDATRATSLRAKAVSAFGYAKANAAPAPFLMYAASELFRLTGDTQYKSAFESYWSAMGSSGAFSNLSEYQLGMGDYETGTLAMPDFFLGYMLTPGASSTLVSTAISKLTSLADSHVQTTLNAHAHRNPRPGNYWDWGMGIAAGRLLDTVIARMALGGLTAAKQQEYLDALSLGADYALGGNPNGLVYFTRLGSRRVEEPLHLDSLAFIKQGAGPVPGIPAYGPVGSLGSYSWMASTLAQFYPAFNSQPQGMRYGDVRTLVNTNEFSVWEVQAPFTELFAILLGPNQAVPADWLSGGAQHLDALP